MHPIDNASEPASTKPQNIMPTPASDASSRTDVALAIAKAYFIECGWRPLVIQPPALQQLCKDVSALLLMNDTGDTAWLSTRDWSALADPIDAFRREMACVRAASVNEAILVFGGDFPDNVVEAAAHEPNLKLIDAVVLRTMSPGSPLCAAAAMPAPTRRQRLARPAQQAVHYLSQVMGARPLMAAERYFQDKFAHRLRQLDGERRRLKTLSTALLVLVGASLGFLAFNMVILMQAPETDEAGSRAARTNPQPLPQPLPPPQGYVAQAAGVSGSTMRGAYVSPRPHIVPKPMVATAAASISSGPEAALAIADSGTARGYEDVEQLQRRADDAMRVIADSTREVHRTRAPAVSASGQPSVRPVDQAMADNEFPPPDPASID